jgi:hypothetical protein
MNNIAGINNKVTAFSSGAVRDVQEDKGRCDLMPLNVIGELSKRFPNISSKCTVSDIFNNLHNFIYQGDTAHLIDAICEFVYVSHTWDSYESTAKLYNMLLDVSMHYKHGLEKYGERNWEKGIPLHSFIDSGTRHLIKYLGGYTDERHDLAFIWNLMCCAYTNNCLYSNAELRDLPFNMFETKLINNPNKTQITATNNLGWAVTTSCTSTPLTEEDK